MAMTHNTDISVYTMVYSRLPFLVQSADNEALLSQFIVEYMYELDICFKVDAENTTPSHIGNEQYYSILQRSIIADLVAMSVLNIQIMANMTGSSSSGVTAGEAKFLKSAKAGSVDVEWEQFDVDTSLVLSGEKLMDSFIKSAIRKARNLDCMIDICEDCGLSIASMLQGDSAILKVITDNE